MSNSSSPLSDLPPGYAAIPDPAFDRLCYREETGSIHTRRFALMGNSVDIRIEPQFDLMHKVFGCFTYDPAKLAAWQAEQAKAAPPPVPTLEDRVALLEKLEDSLRFGISQLCDRVYSLESVNDFPKPLTIEEAEAAYIAAVPVPFHEERIKEVVERITGKPLRSSSDGAIALWRSEPPDEDGSGWIQRHNGELCAGMWAASEGIFVPTLDNFGIEPKGIARYLLLSRPKVKA